MITQFTSLFTLYFLLFKKYLQSLVLTLYSLRLASPVIWKSSSCQYILLTFLTVKLSWDTPLLPRLVNTKWNGKWIHSVVWSKKKKKKNPKTHSKLSPWIFSGFYFYTWIIWVIAWVQPQWSERAKKVVIFISVY